MSVLTPALSVALAPANPLYSVTVLPLLSVVTAPPLPPAPELVFIIVLVNVLVFWRVGLRAPQGWSLLQLSAQSLLPLPQLETHWLPHSEQM